MASTAVSAQGTTLALGAVLAAKTITGISKANPAVVTATAHGYTGGEVVQIASVAGMVEINSKVGIVNVLSANTFQLMGVDSTSFTTYTSGGTSTGIAPTVANLKSYNGFDGQKTENDVSNLSSAAKEYRDGLKDSGTISLELQVDDSDLGQLAMRASQRGTGVVTKFVFALPNGKTRTFSGFVKQFTEQGAVDGVITGNVQIRISGDVIYA